MVLQKWNPSGIQKMHGATKMESPWDLKNAWCYKNGIPLGFENATPFGV